MIKKNNGTHHPTGRRGSFIAQLLGDEMASHAKPHLPTLQLGCLLIFKKKAMQEEHIETTIHEFIYPLEGIA